MSVNSLARRALDIREWYNEQLEDGIKQPQLHGNSRNGFPIPVGSLIELSRLGLNLIASDDTVFVVPDSKLHAVEKEVLNG